MDFTEQTAALAAWEQPSLSVAEFARIRRLAHDHFGLDIKEGKQGLVLARLGKALKRGGFTSFEQYCRHVAEDSGGQALAELADALTTNFTSFLREPAHFEHLRRDVAARIAPRSGAEIWSAASSTGEEPYSILFTLLDILGPQSDVRVLATDISMRALAGVREAVYESDHLRALPPGWLRRYFLRGNGRWQGWCRVKPEFRDRVTCRRFNLVSDEVPAERFPVIFCRNVMIYFDKQTQGRVVRRLASALEPGGSFLIGHSESLAGVDHPLEYVEPAVYRAPRSGHA